MKQLLVRAHQGDKASEDKLFELVLARFNLYARRWIGERDAAADIAQETCITILAKYKTEDFEKGFEAWAYGVLRMNIRHYFHKLSAAKRAESEKEETIRRTLQSNQSVDPDIELALVKCLKKILGVNRRYARTVNLVYQGYRSDEICKRMDISRNNFYVILNRARSVLKKCLEQGIV